MNKWTILFFYPYGDTPKSINIALKIWGKCIYSSWRVDKNEASFRHDTGNGRTDATEACTNVGIISLRVRRCSLQTIFLMGTWTDKSRQAAKKPETIYDTICKCNIMYWMYWKEHKGFLVCCNTTLRVTKASLVQTLIFKRTSFLTLYDYSIRPLKFIMSFRLQRTEPVDYIS